MGELKDKFNKMKGKRNQAGSPPYYVNEILEDIIDKVESGGKYSGFDNDFNSDFSKQ